MNNQSNSKSSSFVRAIKKLSLSAFVAVTFIAYALQKSNGSDGKTALSVPATSGGGGTTPQLSAPPATAAPADPIISPTATAQPPTDIPSTATTVPTAPAPNAVGQTGQYKDGTYTGPEVDALYGLVQVQTVIQHGKIAQVQFLEYPNDRRTSVRINSIAVPDLQQEAMQAQSANVDLITGATLTSEAFQMSLQGALDKARS